MTVQQRLLHEINAVATATLYFGCWIAALLLLKSLILAEYRIAFSRWSMVIVGALILSKVVLVLDHVPLGAWVRARPAWMEVVLRTIMYSLGVAVVLILEKGFEARHEFGGFTQAVWRLFQEADTHHVWANIIGTSGALLGYNVFSEIQRQFGKGTLKRIFFTPPRKETEFDPPERTR